MAVRGRRLEARNLLAALPDDLTEERFEELARGRGVRIERIVSLGHRSPPGFWYDQSEAEWVMVLSGRAALRIEGRPGPIELGPGDYVEIAAGVRHRVEWTTAGEPTVWLAVHFE